MLSKEYPNQMLSNEDPKIIEPENTNEVTHKKGFFSNIKVPNLGINDYFENRKNRKIEDIKKKIEELNIEFYKLEEDLNKVQIASRNGKITMFEFIKYSNVLSSEMEKKKKEIKNLQERLNNSGGKKSRKTKKANKKKTTKKHRRKTNKK